MIGDPFDVRDHADPKCKQCDGTGQTLEPDSTGLLDYVEVYCGCTAGVALRTKDESAADDFADLVERSKKYGAPQIVNVSQSQMVASLVVHDTEGERWARLRGLTAMLALPETRGLDGEMRKRIVEIEVTDGVWARVASVVIEDQRVTFLSAIGVEYAFIGGRVPKWRMA